MSFLEKIENNQINVWKDFYIDYKLLKKILKPAKEIFQNERKIILEKQMKTRTFSANIDNTRLLDDYLDEKEAQKLKETENLFYNQVTLELKKVNVFYKENYKSFSAKFKNIQEQLKHASKNEEFKMYEQTFELLIKELYKGVWLLNNFINLNIEIKDEILRKASKYLDKIEENKNYEESNNNDDYSPYYFNKSVSIKEKVNNFVRDQTEIVSSLADMDKFITELFMIFDKYFLSKYKEDTRKELKNYVIKNKFTDIQSFYLGFVVGLIVFILVIIFIIGYTHQIDMDVDIEFKSVFPMIRGFFVVCLYWWLFGICVYVWNKTHISYRIMFHIDDNYSSAVQIFRRAAVFTFILLVCTLIYMIKRANPSFFFGLLTYIPINSLPLICWGSLILYWFCPFNIWNMSGRAFLGNLATESLGSFLLKVEFRHKFFISVICSFISTLRDLEYTVCYFAYYDAPLEVKKQFCSKTRGIYFFIAFFPHMIKIFQILKEIKDTSKVYPSNLSIYIHTLSITVSFLSFLSPTYPSLVTFWLIFTFISSVCHFLWDVKMDFGLFEKGEDYPLRKSRYFKNKFIYYFTLIFDFIMRFFWLLTISPEILGSLFRPETLSIILGSLEMIRRTLWGILKVEKKHIDISKEYKITYEIEMPYIKNAFGKFVNNESNLMALMNMKREDKIQLEIKKILTEKKQNFYSDKHIEDISLAEKKSTNNILNEYLASYRNQTEFTVPNHFKTRNNVINTLSRKL